MIGALAAKRPLSQTEAIRLATEKSVRARNLYTEQNVAELTGMLAGAEEEVRRAILRYKSLGSLPDNKLAALEGLKKLQADIQETTSRLHREQTLLFRKTAKTSFRQGIYRGIDEFAAAQFPFYRDLTPEGIDKLATRVFTLVDTDALDFMTNYNLVLAGDVNRELADGIKRVVMGGIATGKGVEDIVRDLGRVVKDPESFRYAGSKVFTKAQYRMEVIARTEVLRAHNQGRIKFHDQVGVRKLEWMTMEDERVCPICGPLDGKVFDTNRFPQQPAHPNCRCTSVVAWPLVICGGELGAKAADEPAAALLKRIRAAGLPLRVIMLTARSEVGDRVAGLKAGADDYLTKPFALEELLARIDALGRRGGGTETGTLLHVGDISMDIAKHRITRAGERVELSPREFEVLQIFMQEPGRTFTRDEICERIWEREHEYDTRTVEIFIMRLRKKLDRPGSDSVIGTVRGVGYFMRPT